MFWSMHNQHYVGRIALCTRKKMLKSGEIRHFYGIVSSRHVPYPSFVFDYIVLVECRYLIPTDDGFLSHKQIVWETASFFV